MHHQSHTVSARKKSRKLTFFSGPCLTPTLPQLQLRFKGEIQKRGPLQIERFAFDPVVGHVTVKRLMSHPIKTCDGSRCTISWEKGDNWSLILQDLGGSPENNNHEQTSCSCRHEPVSGVSTQNTSCRANHVWTGVHAMSSQSEFENFILRERHILA